MDKRLPGIRHRKTTPSKVVHKWNHTGMHHMRFEESKFPGQSLAERMMISNTYDLIINGK